LQLTRRSQPPYPWPPEQAQPGVSKPCRTTAGCPWLDGKNFQNSDFLIPPVRNLPPAATNIPSPTVDAQQPITSPPPSPPPPSYVAKDGYDLPGNDLPNMPLAKESSSDCELACNASNGCVAYVFNKPYKKCFLKYAVGTLFENEVGYTGVNQNNQIQRVSPLKFQKETGIVGVFYKSTDNTKFSDCTLECASDFNCQAFNYDSTTKQCTMLRTVTNMIAMPTMSSGVKSNAE
jgi:hypothetical protein